MIIDSNRCVLILYQDAEEIVLGLLQVEACIYLRTAGLKMVAR